MAFYLSDQEVQDIMMRHQQKQSMSGISAAIGRDPKTVRKVVADATAGSTPIRRSRRSKLDPYKQYIEDRFTQGCQNAAVLWEEARAQGFSGSLSLVKQYVAPLRPQRGVEPTQRYETDPGYQAQCDWADFGQLVYPDGETRKLYIFAYTMSYSRRLYIEFVQDQRQPTLFACLEHAWAWFGCLPATLLSDNMTPMVVSHSFDGEIVWNPRFTAFAAFHGFQPKAARPYRAQTKGKVERTVQYVRQNFWPRIPDAITLAELNTRVLEWALQRDQRIHGTTFERPVDRWPADLAGATPYDLTRLWLFGETWSRRVTVDAFVHWQGHRFAVPWEAAGHAVQVRRSASGHIEIRQANEVLVDYAVPTTPHQVLGADQWHASAPPARVPGQPVARRRALVVPQETVAETRDLQEYAEVVPV